MKKYSVFLVLLGLLIGLQADGQNKDLRWGLGLHPSSLSFFALKDGVFNVKEYEPGVQFSVNRYFNPSFDFGLESSLARVRHPQSTTLVDSTLLDRDFFFDVNPFIKYKLNNGYILKEDFFLAPFAKLGVGVNKQKNSKLGFYVPLDLGVNFRVTENAYASLQSGFNLGSNNYLHHSLGIIINFNGKKVKKLSPELGDEDRDGIPDYLDRCPRLRAEGSTTGCPDLDRDGVLDLEDRCPTVKGFSNLMGCLDSDMDGIADPEDKCPSDFGSLSNKGCPDSFSDKDGDLISNDKDKCPDTPGVFTAGGCPDKDADGIEDEQDACPEIFGELRYAGCPYDEKGMRNLERGIDPEAPEGTRIVVAPSTTTSPSTVTSSPVPATTISSDDPCNVSKATLDDIGQAIDFDSDKAKIKLGSKGELDKIVTLLQNCASTNILIRAHTDADGDADYNKRLSERRAYAVFKHLTRQGIDRTRISTEGLGETEPLVANDTPANKGINRRLEFILLPK